MKLTKQTLQSSTDKVYDTIVVGGGAGAKS